MSCQAYYRVDESQEDDTELPDAKEAENVAAMQDGPTEEVKEVLAAAEAVKQNDSEEKARKTVTDNEVAQAENSENLAPAEYDSVDPIKLVIDDVEFDDDGSDD